MREARINRKTKETDINLHINLDGKGIYKGSCGIGFMNHMLSALCTHSGLDIDLQMQGDLHIDGHHSVEDLAIVLGKAINKAIGENSVVTRFGSAYIPMDESLGFCAIDISGRPFLVFNAEFNNQYIGELDTCLIEEFFRAVAFNSKITLHLNCLYGSNDHHKAESLFKAFAHAFKQGIKKKDGEVLSTKGSLD